MHIAKHWLITSGAAGALLVISSDINWRDYGMMLLGGVVIDLDHVVYFLIKNRGFDLEKAKRMHEEMFKNSIPGFFLFHTWVALLLFSLGAATGWLNGFFYGGYVLHLMSDIWVYLRRKKGIMWVQKWSVGYQLYLAVEQLKTKRNN